MATYELMFMDLSRLPIEVFSKTERLKVSVINTPMPEDVARQLGPEGAELLVFLPATSVLTSS